MQYNSMERLLALLLTKFPKIKQVIKKTYQRLNYIKFKKTYNFKSKYTLHKLTINDKESYFGYYDKSPINKTNEYIVFQVANIETCLLPNCMIPVDIVIYNIKDDNYEVIDKSYTYNWQQGSKIMWIDEYKFIYNDFNHHKKQYISKIYDVILKETKSNDYPIYDCYNNKFALSLNFERLNIVRADYSYNNIETQIDWKNNCNDGVYYIDLETNSSKLIITLQEVIKINFKETMKNAKHKFNHIMISPNGKKMMFMHRWFLKDGRKFDSLYISDINGSNLKCICDDEMVSHCFWYNDNKIFGYLRDKIMGNNYYMVNTLTNKKEIIGKNIINCFGDGHPNINGDKIIFDTYPNKARMKELYAFDLKTKKLDNLGEFYESFEFYGETRCDLHPRFSYDGKKVFFDSVHDGKRNLYMMELKK